MTLTETIIELIQEAPDVSLEEIVHATLTQQVGGLAGRIVKEVTHEVLVEYLNESNHNSWDGWSTEQLQSVKGFFEDLLCYTSMR